MTLQSAQAHPHRRGIARVTIIVPIDAHGSAALTMPEGGPPSVRLTRRSSGAITTIQWDQATRLDLAGCVPDARIVALRFFIKDCRGKDAMAGSESSVLTAYRCQMIRNMPPGTSFKAKVVVRDAKGKTYDVPEAHLVWKG